MTERVAEALLDLQRLTVRLRRECPWDREQTVATIVPHTVEEAYEVADAALSGDEVVVTACLFEGTGSATAWGCDLTEEYIKINGSYRS